MSSLWPCDEHAVCVCVGGWVGARACVRAYVHVCVCGWVGVGECGLR